MATTIPNINGAVVAGIGTGTEISCNATRRSVFGLMPAPSTLSTALRIPTGSLLINSGPSRGGRVDSFLTGFSFSSSSIRSFAAESAGEQVQAHSSAQGIENLVIVGSGPAGYTAAIYAARANLKPVVFEGFQVGGVPGGQLMTTTEVENFPGFPDGITGPDLMDRMRRQAERWGGELFQEDVEFIDVKNTPFTVRSSERKLNLLDLRGTAPCDALVLTYVLEYATQIKWLLRKRKATIATRRRISTQRQIEEENTRLEKSIEEDRGGTYVSTTNVSLDDKSKSKENVECEDRGVEDEQRIKHQHNIPILEEETSHTAESSPNSPLPDTSFVKPIRSSANSLIIATGARAQRLRLPREDEFWSRGISACAICDGASPLFKGQVLAVVGGGDTATEEAIYLTKYASHVHLLVRRDQLRASKAMQDRIFNNPNITVHFNTEIVDVVSNSKGQMSGILIRTVDTGEESVLEAKGLFYGIGHSPNSKLLEGQVELDSAGYILVKESTAKTSVEGVFAAGDVQDHEWRQAVTAAGSGCLAALSVERYLTSKNLLVEFHQPQAEDNKKELTEKDVQEGFDITYAKHKGQYALRKLYHESPRLLCVLYTSPSCGPCRTLKPILSKVIDEFDQHVHFVEIDITEDPEIAEAAEIMGTPCVQFFKNKEMLRTISGVKMKREYRELIGANK